MYTLVLCCIKSPGTFEPAFLWSPFKDGGRALLLELLRGVAVAVVEVALGQVDQGRVRLWRQQAVNQFS